VSPRRSRAEQGSAIVDFVLVGTLLTLLFVVLLQLAVVLHVRNVLADCATEGARYGALAGQDPAAGAQRTRELIAADLSSAYAGGVEAGHARQGALDTVVVRVRAPLPAIGLLGLGRLITVSGHAVAEQP
jgi:hypothetical protein